MAIARVRDTKLKEAFEELAAAQASEDQDTTEESRLVAEKSDEVARKDAKSAKRQIFWVNLLSLIAGGVIVLILFWLLDPTSGSEKDTRRALCWAAIVIYLVYALLGGIRWVQGGLLSYIRGKDGRLATSLLQVGLWTIAVSSALVYFIFLAFYSDDAAKTFKTALGGENLPEEYLLLLGGPFAAAVVARLTVGSKVDDQELQKVKGNAKLLDVVADDDGQANLVDAQFLVFNLVALTWFGGALIESPTVLPDIPDLLVGLTSTSALAYMGAKGVASNRPVITSVTRYVEAARARVGAPRPGDLVEIRGMNFIPAGAEAPALVRKIVVKFGDVDQSPRFKLDQRGTLLSPSDDAILARVPLNVTPGTIRVSVVTAAGIEADPRDLVITEDKPVITGVPPAGAKRGKEIHIRGRYFRNRRAARTDHSSVQFGTTVIEASADSREGLTVTVPRDLGKGPVNVRVRAAGGSTWSDPVTLTIT